MNVLMTPFYAWAGLILLMAPCLMLAQTNDIRPLYSTGFEPEEGYDIALTLAGQQGWSSSGTSGNGLVTNTFPGGGQQAYIGYFPPEDTTNALRVWRPLFASGSPAEVELSSSVLIFPSTNQHADDFRWTIYNQQSNALLSLIFNNEQKMIWAQGQEGPLIYTGITFSNSVIYELVVTIDYSSNRWSARVGGVTAVTNQTLASTNISLTLGQVEVGWSPRQAGTFGNNYMVFDDLRVTLRPATLPPPSQVLYATGFEPSEGFDRGFNLAGQGGWRQSGSGGNGLLTNAFPGLGQQGYLGYFPPEGGTNYLYLWHPINYQPSATNLLLLQFSTWMQIVNSTNQNFDDFRWSFYNTAVDRLFSINFNNQSHQVTYQLDGGGDFLATGRSFSNDMIYELVVRIDFASNSWNAILNGDPIITNQPVTTTNALLTLGDIDAVWLIRNTNAPGNNYMVFDDYRIVTLDSRTNAPPPLRLEIISGLGGGPPYAVRVQAPPGTPYILDASTNLFQWTPFWTNTVPEEGFSEFVEGPEHSSPNQFFRARTGS